MAQGKPNLMIKSIVSITPGKEVTYEIYNGEVQRWRIPRNSTFNTSSILVGGSYNVWSKNINPNGRPTYDWLLAQPVGPATKLMHANMVLPAVQGVSSEQIAQAAVTALQQTHTLRDDVEDLIQVVAGQALTPEMEALLVVLCQEMDANPSLFTNR